MEKAGFTESPRGHQEHAGVAFHFPLQLFDFFLAVGKVRPTHNATVFEGVLHDSPLLYAYDGSIITNRQKRTTVNCRCQLSFPQKSRHVRAQIFNARSGSGGHPAAGH
jgi:hypothetical protein